MPIDDAGLEFRRQEQTIVRDLGIENVYDLPPSMYISIALIHMWMIFQDTSRMQYYKVD